MPWALWSHRTCLPSLPYWCVVLLQLLMIETMLTFHPNPGFLTKIKKLLETVCHNCGKIKANTVSHLYRDGKS